MEILPTCPRHAREREPLLVKILVIVISIHRPHSSLIVHRDICGHVWTCVDMCGHAWTSVNICGHYTRLAGLTSRTSVDTCGLVWTCVDMCGHVWTCVDMCGHVWTLDPGPRCAYCAAVRPDYHPTRPMDMRRLCSSFDRCFPSYQVSSDVREVRPASRV